MRNRLFTIGLMLTLAVITASAQRLSCFPPSEQAGTRQQSRYSVPEVKTFDPQKTYRQPVYDYRVTRVSRGLNGARIFAQKVAVT